MWPLTERGAQEVGEGAGRRAWLGSERRGGSGWLPARAARLPTGLGRPNRGKWEESKGGRCAGRRGNERAARPERAGPEGRKGEEEKKKTFFFLFSRVLANHFQIDFESNSNLVKTNHYKNKCAAACMHQEVTNLIFDFNFTKIIIFLYLNAQIIT